MSFEYYPSHQRLKGNQSNQKCTHLKCIDLERLCMHACGSRAEPNHLKGPKGKKKKTEKTKADQVVLHLTLHFQLVPLHIPKHKKSKFTK